MARVGHLSDGLQKKIASLPEDKGLLLWGTTGVGKTYCMCALMREFLLAGKKAQRISYEMLCLQLRDTYKPDPINTELSIIQPLIAVPKLFLEDVGTTVSGDSQESDFGLRTFLVLLDQRIEDGRATFITTNKSVEQLSRSFDARVASRLQQACDVIHLTGPDRRVTK